jgi:hypothetical protein
MIDGILVAFRFVTGRIERYADLAAAIMSARPRLGAVRLVSVDGAAGSGKTTFAGRLAGSLRQSGAAVAEIHTDDLLEGWSDIAGFWPRLDQWILAPLRRGEPGRYRRYDWHRERFDDRWEQVPVPDVLLVEGVTSARAAIAPYLSISAVVVARRDLRLHRGIARDGEALRAKWLRWMADEDAHFAADRPQLRADRLVDGAPAIAHDPECEYVRLPGGAGPAQHGS